jgi:predicted nucleic acid-binding protein
MLIVDTSVWIEFFRGEKDYHAALLPLIEAGHITALEGIFGELLQGARDERERKLLEQFWEALPKAEIPRLLLLAGRLASVEKYSQKGVGLIDATIVAAARRLKAQVWSLDKKLNAVLQASERYEAKI